MGKNYDIRLIMNDYTERKFVGYGKNKTEALNTILSEFEISKNDIKRILCGVM